ncbi:MAG TPA: ATP-binding cassette domain-containing protein, partial [Firmicutes bacterium]|nr:ATP-binding cassette domain-containing protein [Bacillota bacterium]
LSGGERQRLSIARAILKDSPIILLDEATASLDIENELVVKQAIANLLSKKKTVIIIAHTLSIVRNADKILVVDNGKIAEEGTHDELLAKKGKYANMWEAEQKLIS